MSDKVWGVLLTDAGLSELQVALRSYLRSGPVGQYLYCRSVDLSGSFAQLIVESTEQATPFVGQLHIPLHHIKFVVAAAEFKQIGFA
ncbi:MAG: hypothetical protein AB7S51_11900 [Porticoccaceae bacterium]